jgi:hypothetical protein
MKKLPAYSLIQTPLWQKERLARWLAEWDVDRNLGPAPRTVAKSPGRPSPLGEGVPGFLASSGPRILSAGENSQICAGQIRLLYPHAGATRMRLLYVAILEVNSARLLVAPFGKFTEPAMPGEWLTGRSEPGLRVLGLWNARSLPLSIIPDSWLVELLPESTVADARAVWESHHTGITLPAELEKRVGPPIVHPLDPRREYLEQEKIFMDQIEAFAESLSTAVSLAESLQARSSEMALAAESARIYETTAQFQLVGSSLALRVSPGPERGSREVLIVDEHGQPCQKLDGGILRTPDGTRSPPIVNAKLVVSSHLLIPGVVVAMPDGRRLPLKF